MATESMAILILLGSFFIMIMLRSPSLMRWRFPLCSAWCTRGTL